MNFMGPKTKSISVVDVRKHRTPKRIVAPGRSGPPVTGATTLSPWQNERAKRLHAIFSSAETRQKEAGSLARCLKPFVRSWKGKSFHCDPKRQARFSYGTLRNLFYHWCSSGRTPECLLLRYRATSGRKVTESLLQEFISTCVSPGWQSMGQAWRDMRTAHEFLWEGPGDPPSFPSRAAFMRALTPEQRSAIISLQQANLAAQSARERFRKVFE